METLLPIAARAGALLKARGDTIAVAESSTGGLVAAALLAVPGASAYFLGGSVVYTRQAREALLGIERRALAAAPPASEEMAALLAEAARQRLGTVWALGEAGATGPTGNRYGHAAGHGVFAVAGPVPKRLTIETGSPDRVGNMRAFGERLLGLLVEALEAAP
ncbi:CinA family protein [Paracraurococcus ruber]|uniref:Damage-inducible protein n=1 Tax=Paracraurococcus ruber TaxID=77675 RepID=A0ABS1CZD1_9PROT|nr:CinA family protein [Paracraurococcus ruber]MBK1659044.1 damage-inducible protein [Paracraurococcus ruber]TDG31304.1 CinA family protein [Paracraurococcus ruber]